MHARQAAEPGLVIDVSLQETLATMAIGELARAGLGRTIWSHRRTTDGNGAIVTILPASDAYADLAAARTATGSVAQRDGLARLGSRPAVCDEARSRR